MPYARKTNKRRRPKTRKARRGKRYPLTTKVSLGGDGKGYGFPSSMMTKLRYFTGNIGGSASTTMLLWSFRANSLFDPDLTGTGGQPLWHDQIAAVYQNYRVVKVKMEAIFNNGTPNSVATCFIVPTASAVAGVFDLQNMSERAYDMRLASGERGPIRFSKTFDIAKMDSISKTIWNADPGYAADMGANPAKAPAVSICFQNMDQVNTVGVQVTAILTYYVKFFKLIQVSAS